MYQNLPKKVTLIEVGPRDGFQFETKIVPTDLKVEIICGLMEAGVKHIQAVSFVHPKIVPQMADAEEVMRRIPKREDVVLSALVLNAKGLERARAAGLTHVEISVSASDTHSRKNTGMSLSRAIEQGQEMIRLAKTYGMQVRAGIQCAFGCVYEGQISDERILNMAEIFMKPGIDALCLADTTGMANPLSVKGLLKSLTEQLSILNSQFSIPVVLHLHDTRGLGLANAAAALECGVSHFDTALGGMGGCPFVVGAAGNIATEDTAYLMKSMNIEIGIDISKVSACSRRLEAFFAKMLPGKMFRLILKELEDYL
jgi:hydroxymethylglutaryl-CoA lyase